MFFSHVVTSLSSFTSEVHATIFYILNRKKDKTKVLLLALTTHQSKCTND